MYVTIQNNVETSLAIKTVVDIIMHPAISTTLHN